MTHSASMDELSQYSVLVCAPIYGSTPEFKFMNSLLSLQSFFLTQTKIAINFFFVTGESAIARARNTCTNYFVKNTQYTHMLFIDADIGFDAKAVLDMLIVYHQDPAKYRLLTIPYPKKTIAWEKINHAARSGVNHPDELSKFMIDLVINPSSGNSQFKLSEPLPVSEAGTGFMMMDRQLLSEFEAAHPDRRYLVDLTRSDTFGEENVMYFNFEIDPESRRYLSEDYLFCKHVQQLGYEIWCIPWFDLEHVGKIGYKGSIVELSKKGLPLTMLQVDADSYRKTPNKKVKL